MESIINGRPLTKVSDEPRDPEALTPNHLLILRSGPTLPPGTFVKEDSFSRRQWCRVQYLADVFWRRWMREYLPALQERRKWNKASRNFTAVLSDITSAQELFNLLDSFTISSCLSINWSKTEGMWIGSTRSNKTKPLGINWPNEPIRALGIFYTYDLKLLHEKNFLENLDNIKKLLSIWYSRGLSLYGKVTVTKSLVVPKVIYVSSLMSIPKDIITELNHLLFKFLWNGTDKVTRLSTINEYQLKI